MQDHVRTLKAVSQSNIRKKASVVLDPWTTFWAMLLLFGQMFVCIVSRKGLFSFKQHFWPAPYFSRDEFVNSFTIESEYI